jgi:chromosome segregation ATPase
MKILKDLDKLHSTHAEYKSWIEKLNSLNEKYENYLQEKRDNWNDKLNPLFGKLKSQPKELIELQSLCLSYRQQLTEEIAFFMNKLSKEIIDYKNAKSDRFMFYATGFGLKTNLSEKSILIDSELAQLQRNKELFESHIEFLRECKVACDNVNWAIKNRLEIYKIIDQ